MRIAYFTNQYPAVSHTFIRREIQALEALGETVIRFAIRPTVGAAVHVEDQSEFHNTKYILQTGYGEILCYLISTILWQPVTMAKIVAFAVKIGWRSDRGLLRHFAYAIEAVVLAAWCRQESVQHLHAHFGTNSTTVAMMAGTISNIPYSFTAHGSEEFEKAPLLSLDFKLSRAAFAVCVSSFGRAQLMRWSPPELWNKIAVVHCGVDNYFLEEKQTPVPAVPTLVCVGRLGEHKAQLVLVEAVRRLRDANIKCQVTFAGDGPMRPHVEAAIKCAKLEDWIEITGWVPSERIRAEITAARALVLPSFSENMPTVLMEALALGRPVISTYIAGIPELVTPGKTGWLIPAGDDALLAEALREVLASPTERLTAMGTAGRAHIIEQHDAAKEAKKLRALFHGSHEQKNKAH